MHELVFMDHVTYGIHYYVGNKNYVLGNFFDPATGLTHIFSECPMGLCHRTQNEPFTLINSKEVSDEYIARRIISLKSNDIAVPFPLKAVNLPSRLAYELKDFFIEDAEGEDEDNRDREPEEDN